MSTFTFPILNVRTTPDQYAHCTITTCPISTSYWYYRPSLPANSILLVFFTLSLIAFLTTYLTTRRFASFTIALSAGCMLEILGYAGRIIAHGNLWHQPGFLLQIVCLTIAPAFMAAGVYMCLRRIVYAFGKQYSRVSPEAYTRFFISCDVLSLVLQALGGGMASARYHQGKSPALGDHIMVAGLAFQVLTLGIFITLSIDFTIRTIRNHRSVAADPRLMALRSTMRFRAFLVALSTTTFCIFARSVYRVIELAEGWQGHLVRQQWLFFGLEGVMVIIAVAVLNFAHPAFCFIESEEKETEEKKESV